MDGFNYFNIVFKLIIYYVLRKCRILFIFFNKISILVLKWFIFKDVIIII